MSLRVIVRPEVADDIAGAATWYEERQPGLGPQFMNEIFKVWDALAENPLLNSRRTTRKHIRWRFSERFPYRVIYEIDEPARRVVVHAVLHAARHDRHWRARI